MKGFYLHAGCMVTATVLLLTGAMVARVLRRKSWWLNAHRRIGLGGVVLLFAGFLSAIVMISFSGQPHFGSPHTWMGGLTLSGGALTPALGFSSLRFPAFAAVIRWVHRVWGWFTGMMGILTTLSGLFLSGIL